MADSSACGSSSACAMGWATACFPGEGLRMLYANDRDRRGTVVYRGESGFEAAQQFFEIPFDDAVALFSVAGDAEVIAAARGLLERGHSPETVRKVLGENLLRVMEDVEKVAAGLRAPAP